MWCWVRVANVVLVWVAEWRVCQGPTCERQFGSVAQHTRVTYHSHKQLPCPNGLPVPSSKKGGALLRGGVLQQEPHTLLQLSAKVLGIADELPLLVFKHCFRIRLRRTTFTIRRNFPVTRSEVMVLDMHSLLRYSSLLGRAKVVCVVEFQKRLQLKSQDEVQSQHWDQDATTIYPCMIYFRWGGRVWAYSFMILSDDMAQDNAWVQYVMSKLLGDDIPALLRKIGAPPMTNATIFTDNCAKQFKCRFHFGWVGDAGVKALDRHALILVLPSMYDEAGKVLGEFAHEVVDGAFLYCNELKVCVVHNRTTIALGCIVKTSIYPRLRSKISP